MRNDIRPYVDLSAVFCDELLLQDAEMFYGANGDTFRKAADLRKNQTPAEELLWEKLRRKQLNGFRFRRQHPIGKYIADFYCPSAKLVIEVDGGIHRTADQIEGDIKRSSDLSKLGLQVLRFTNSRIEHEIDLVIREIRVVLADCPAPLQRLH
jgi:very-short-patch-repair endonuclease